MSAAIVRQRHRQPSEELSRQAKDQEAREAAKGTKAFAFGLPFCGADAAALPRHSMLVEAGYCSSAGCAGLLPWSGVAPLGIAPVPPPPPPTGWPHRGPRAAARRRRAEGVCTATIESISCSWFFYRLLPAAVEGPFSPPRGAAAALSGPQHRLGRVPRPSLGARGAPWGRPSPRRNP